MTTAIARWYSTYHPKPGPTRPICSMCGDDWPCQQIPENPQPQQQGEQK